MYRNEYQLSSASVRISYVYGPPNIPNPIVANPVPEFLKQAFLNGGGDWSCSFTYIEDVATGLLAAYDAETLNHDAYHLGSGENYSTYQVADVVMAAVPGSKITVGPGLQPWGKTHGMRCPLGVGRLEQDAGFKTRYSLESGIEKFADWMKNHPEALK